MRWPEPAVWQSGVARTALPFPSPRHETRACPSFANNKCASRASPTCVGGRLNKRRLDALMRPPLTSGRARSDLVAEHVHAGGTARVALALRVGLELVDVHFAARPGLLIGNMRALLRCRCRIGNPKRQRNRQRDDDAERLELQHAGLHL